MPQPIRSRLYRLARFMERYIPTDMVYVTQSSFWLVLNQAMMAILIFASAVAFAHLLSKDSYGTYKYVLSVIALLGAFSLTGLETAVFRAAARGYESLMQSAFWVRARWSLGSAAGALAMGIYYAVNGNSILSTSLIVASFAMPFIWQLNVAIAFLNGRKLFKASSFINASQAFISTAFLVAVIFFFKQPLVVVLAYLLITAFTNVSFYIYIVMRYKPNDAHDPESLSLSRHLSVMNMLTTIGGQIDKIALYHFLGPVSVAVYSFASAIPQQLTGLVRISYSIVLPKFAQLTLAEGREAVLMRSWYMFAGGSTLAFIYVLIAPSFFALFFSQYMDAVHYSQALVIDFILAALAGLAGGFFDAHALIREKYILNVSVNIFKMAGIVAFGYVWGIWGIILAVLGSRALGTCIIFGIIYRIKPHAH